MKLQKIYLGTFLLAIIVRICIIYFTPQANRLMDLSIYREAGQLVVNGINPYDYNDQKELRNFLRTDSISYNEYTSRDQDSWNFQAGAALPMATLFFGGIEYYFASYEAHRYIYAFFDSLLAVLVLAIVLNKWKLSSSSPVINDEVPKKFQYYLPYIIGLSLAAISPVFLLHVTINPEYKGVGLLLILSAFYFSDNSLKIYSILLSPLLLGFSISFIGLGIFIVPLCFYNIYNNYSFKYLILYGFIAFVSSIIWLVPFLPELITMMNSRMSSVTNIPNHGSMYVIFYKIMSLKSVLLLKNALTFLFIGINIIGLINKRLNIAILSGSLIYTFTCISLVSGNLDRYNIAITMVIIILLYSRFYKMTFLLTLIYLIHGCFTFFYTFITKHLRFDFDGYFILLFSSLYFMFLINQTFKKKKIINEIKY
jgi:hypothetical protein